MITEIHLKNFRGFEDHFVPLRPLTIIVGRNNAGKSTIVEALRLIALVVSRFKGDLAAIPRNWEFPKSRRGPNPFKDLEINLKSVFFDYGAPPALIRAKFDTGEIIEITISDDDITARCDRSKARRGLGSHLSRVSIQPQVGPVSRDERLLTEDYVRGAMSSALAPLHFRNQLNFLSHLFPAFKRAAEETWPGLRIRSLEKSGKIPEPIVLSLFVEDRHFPAELAWMGHGMQMWLQTIWFLTRAIDHETVILDEPDVYMHADLQRRLVRFIREGHKQVVIATHSSDIMSEVEPGNILIVDRSRNRSAFASSLPAVQKVLSGFGSVHNLQLSRLWSAHRFLMVEGDDLALLKPIQNTLYPISQMPIDTIPARSIGGWGGWNFAIGSGEMLENAAGDGIISYCLLDSDFHSSDEIETRTKEAQAKNISLHIWSRKEIENYFLVPSAIRRLIECLMADKRDAPTVEDVEQEIERIANEMRDEVVDCMATCIHAADRKLTVATANQRARSITAGRWKTQSGRFGIIPGKRALSAVSNWAQKNFKVSIGVTAIAHTLSQAEVDEEMVQVVTAIEKGIPFASAGK
jgi:energy-coupling factor transporter ATP-binding protein EcfA2